MGYEMNEARGSYEEDQNAHKIVLGEYETDKSLFRHSMRRKKWVSNLHFPAIHLHQFYKLNNLW